MSPITTHILDTGRGRPAGGVAVVLEFLADSSWTELARGLTDSNGRITDLLPHDFALHPGIYRLRFDTGAYFRGQGVPSFYPEVVVLAQIDDPREHYHIPLLLSPYGYSTYRGS